VRHARTKVPDPPKKSFEKTKIRACVIEATSVQGVQAMTPTEITQMTPTQIRRLAAAIIETETALARATRYSPDLQDAELVAFYIDHLQNLKNEMAQQGA
jgi:hypothetical protein